MRSDYVLYAVAVIFFILTIAVAAYSMEQQLWIVTSAVLGLVFIGVGYTQRPRPTTTTTAPMKAETTAITVLTPPPPPVAQTTPTETVMEQKTESTIGTAKPTIEVGLTSVKGIKEKRAAQLKSLGINTLEELARASAEDLGTKLQISPKITGKWIENAKQILAKS